jgi:hypothetical protein
MEMRLRVSLLRPKIERRRKSRSEAGAIPFVGCSNLHVVEGKRTDARFDSGAPGRNEASYKGTLPVNNIRSRVK